MITQTPQAVTRFLQLVLIYHGPPRDPFKATKEGASRMVKSIFDADSEDNVEDKIVSDKHAAWSLFEACLKPSGHSLDTLTAASAAKLNRDNMGRAIPFLTLAVPRHKYS
jgi:hypothetical protein